MKECLCGCKEKVLNPKRVYISGHNTRRIDFWGKIEKCKNKKCLYCGKKIIEQSLSKLIDKKYCNNSCSSKALGYIGGKRCHELHPDLYSKMGKIGSKKVHKLYPEMFKKLGKQAAEFCKKNKKGFYDSEVCGKGGKIGAAVNRKNKTGLFGLTFEERSKNGKVSGKIGGARAVIVNRRNESSAYFDKKTQAKNALKALKIIRENRNYLFKGTRFDSMKETEIANCLYYQGFIDKFKKGENCHKDINNIEVDFFLKRYNLILEYHPILKFLNHKEKTDKDYYQTRRKILDNNGYKNYNLVVIK